MRTSEAAVPRPFQGLTGFLRTEVLVQAHEELAMATSMVVQGVLLVFVYILNPGLIGVALLGAVIFSMFTMGQRVLNEAAYVRIDHKATDMYLASPLTAEGYFVGLSAGVLVVYIAPVVLVGVLAELVVHLSVTEALLLAGLAMTVWICSASIGYVFSTAFHDNRAIWAYSSLFFNIFGVLPPVFYPFSLFPVGLRPIVLLMPPSAAAAILQNATGAAHLTGGELALAALGLAVEALTLFSFAAFWARRTAREQ